MADTPIDERRFSDREVHEILKRAVEQVPSRAVARSEGLSLAELKAIAAEVGIDPSRLEDAARAVTAAGSGRANRILGAPRVLELERKAEGVLALEDTPEVLSIIRRTLGHQGEANEIRGSLEWGAEGETARRHVTLSERDGVTTVRGSADLSNLAVLTYLPAGIAGVFASIITLVQYVREGSPVALVIGLVVLPILYPILRAIFSRVVGAEAAKLEKVVEDLARLAEESGGRSPDVT